jgi:hypothetical protein
MDTYRYDVETLALRDLGDTGAGSDAQRVIACDHAGRCRVEETLDEVRTALVDRLNERGRGGWRLAHMELHDEVVLLVWESTVSPPERE